jgi:hypothetical protein
MSDDYELTVSYPPNQAGEWIDGELDDQIIDAVGQDTCGSGAGPMTGGRDMHFRFDSRLDAEHAVRRLTEILGKDVEYRWHIMLWSEDGGHRTLAMGQNKSKEVEA